MNSIELCNISLSKAYNGIDRGGCERQKGHNGEHGNLTCAHCGVRLTSETAYPKHHHVCKKCHLKYQRQLNGVHRPLGVKVPNAEYMFPCGCEGILPSKKGLANKFVGNKSVWTCRVVLILHQSARSAKIHGYRPIDFRTPHFIIRKLMSESNCILCNEPLKWEVKAGKTPHLHHDHETGEIYGFAHARCNPNAMEQAMDKLRKENQSLREALEKVMA